MKRRWLTALAVGALALSIRLLYLWQIHNAPFFALRLGDGAAYHDWAKLIAGGDWLGHGVFYQAPLYPYFLAAIYRLFDDTVATTRIVQAFLGAASCALLSLAGLSMFGRRGALAGAALALYPPAIFLDGLIDKSCLVTLLLCALLSVLPARRWFAAGILLGLLALARENALILTIPLLFLARRRASLLVAGCAVILLPVALRNVARGGEFHLTTAQSGPNFYIGNHPGAGGTYEPLVTGHGSAADERDDATRLAEQAAGRTLTTGEVSQYWMSRAFGFIRAHPLEWLGIMVRKAALTLNNAELTDTESQDVYAEWSWLLRIPLSFGLVLAVAAANWRGDRFLWSLAASYAAGVVAFYVLARYRFPLVPILLLLAVSIGRIRPPALVAAAVAALLAFLPLVDPRPGRATNYFAIATVFAKDPARLDDAASFYRRALETDSRFPGAQFGLATILTRQGRVADAIPYFESAISAWPDYAEARYNFGQALAATGRIDEAIGQYTAALRLRAGDADAHVALAEALLKLGRAGEALPHLERALELNPADAAAHLNLGAVLANRGRIAEALPHFERAVALDPTNDLARRNLEAARRRE